jgi:hypothetical protein
VLVRGERGVMPLISRAYLPAQDEPSIGVVGNAAGGQAHDSVHRHVSRAPLNLPSSGVNAIVHGSAAPLQGTSTGFKNVPAVVVRLPRRWDRLPESVAVTPLRHVGVPVTVATPVVWSNAPKPST